MVRRPLLALCAFIAVASVACSSGDDDSTESPSGTVATAAPTTTTTERELTVEEEVEAAYLRAWDVYTEAMASADPSGLEESFADRGLEIVIADIAKLQAAGHRGRMSVEHDYEITVDGETATVIDNYVNHSVVVDAESGEPLEPDPNDVLEYTYTLRLVGETWKVTAITRPSR